MLLQNAGDEGHSASLAPRYRRQKRRLNSLYGDFIPLWLTGFREFKLHVYGLFVINNVAAWSKLWIPFT
jgi:hypothetical protein